MKKAILTGFGKTDKLAVTESPIPTINKNEILVKVMAAAANPKDIFIRKGYYKTFTGTKFPMGVGFDYSGEVVESNHPNFKKGQAVFGMINGWQGRTFAEYLVVNENEICAKPENMDWISAAAIPLAAQTALQALRDIGKIKSGQNIAISGASGGVGTFAIQIAKTFDCKVTTLSSPANFDFCKSLGATQTLDYQSVDFKKFDNQLDIFFDVFGNLSFDKIKNTLTSNGRFVSTVPSIRLALDKYVFTLLSRKKPNIVIVKSKKEDLGWLKTQVEAGKITPIIDAVYPFEDFEKAQLHIEGKRTKGKVIVTLVN
jgi:NADPH:quinone reductase-like Zn-dependent oxidoreductase